jgi:hypothetical protein
MFMLLQKWPFDGKRQIRCQLCQSWQPEMRLDYSGTKIIQIFIVTNRFSHSWSRCRKCENCKAAYHWNNYDPVIIIICIIIRDYSRKMTSLTRCTQNTFYKA